MTNIMLNNIYTNWKYPFSIPILTYFEFILFYFPFISYFFFLLLLFVVAVFVPLFLTILFVLFFWTCFVCTTLCVLINFIKSTHLLQQTQPFIFHFAFIQPLRFFFHIFNFFFYISLVFHCFYHYDFRKLTSVEPLIMNNEFRFLLCGGIS